MREYKSKTKEIILTTTIETPVGEMFAACTKKGLVMFTYFAPLNLEARIDILKKSFDADIIPSNCDLFDNLRVQLEEYFNKKRDEFDIPMQLVGSNFQIEIYKKLLEIPYGKTFSLEQFSNSFEYKANSLKSPIAQNMIHILVPCHRIKDIDIYSGGIDKKEKLLKLEEK